MFSENLRVFIDAKCRVVYGTNGNSPEWTPGRMGVHRVPHSLRDDCLSMAPCKVQSSRRNCGTRDRDAATRHFMPGYFQTCHKQRGTCTLRRHISVQRKIVVLPSSST